METKNYKLYLEDDDTTKFKEWREKMNGVDDSNMVKIDAALSEKSDKSTSVECTLLASAWVGTSAPFTQELIVNGLSASHNGNISVSNLATADQRASARDAIMSVTKQDNGKLTISADGTVPDIDIPVCVILLG